MTDEPADRRRLTLLGKIPDRRGLYVWGDQDGKLGVATAEAVRHMPELFGKPIRVPADTFASEPVVYIAEYGYAPHDAVSVGVTRRRVELSTVASNEYNCAVTCAFDAPTRQWYVSGGVRSLKKSEA